MRQFEIDETMPHFTIYGKLPTINDYISACRRNAHCGANMKSDYTNISMWSMKDIYGMKFNKVVLHYRFFEEKKNRDKDNVFSFATKVVQDAMQELGLIENDGWKQIENFTHDFFIDKENPRIEVYIEEVGKEKE